MATPKEKASSKKKVKKDKAAKGKDKVVKSLKIDRKKKTKKVKRSRKKMVIKQSKLVRAVKKLRGLVKKNIKTACKGMKMSALPDKVYKKIDVAIAGGGLDVIVEAAVVDAINKIPDSVKDGTRQPRKKVRKKKDEAVAAE